MVSLVEEEFETFTNERRWKQVFDRIQNEVTTIYNLTVKCARLPENRERNRYRDVSPYDDYRVHLECSDNDYINASNVEVPKAGRKYILTQGPLAATAGHFWLMVWQQNSRGVIMLNKVVEDGRLKCHPYFPMGAEFGGEDSLTYENVDIRVDYVKTKDSDYFVTRTLRLVHLQTLEEKKVYQFHYMDWPDFGIPKNSESFLSFLYAVRQSGVIPSYFSHPDGSSQPQIGPPVIHCSAGIGRSGTFCLVDSALILVDSTKSLASLDLRTMLIEMRKYRHGLIQRPEQLKFSYMAVIDGAHEILSSTINGDETEEMSESGDSCLSEGEEWEETTANGQIPSPREDDVDDGPTPPERTSSLESTKKRKIDDNLLDSDLIPSQNSVAQASTAETPQFLLSVAQPSISQTPQSMVSVAQPSTAETPQSVISVAQPSIAEDLQSEISEAQPSTDDTSTPSHIPASSGPGANLTHTEFPEDDLSQVGSSKDSSHQANLPHTTVRESLAPLSKETPDPPKRTSSLYKSASLEEPPPLVPPRPDRQISAPSIPERLSPDSQTDRRSDDEDMEHGYENTSSRPIGMYNNAMKRKREEKHRKTQAKVATMKAKQKASEETRGIPWYHSSRRVMLIGAGTALTLALGVMFIRSAAPL